MAIHAIFLTPLCFTLVYFLDKQQNRTHIAHYHIRIQECRLHACVANLACELCELDLNRLADVAALAHVEP